MSDSVTPQYVAGFLFRTFPNIARGISNNQVALILKNKPAWQKGRLNGIGGKIEEGELPVEAMIREFQEETSVLVEDWKHFCRLEVEHGPALIHFFAAECTRGGQELLDSPTEEQVAWHYTCLLVDDQYLVTNLRWLVPLAKEALSNPKVARIISKHP